MSSDTVLDVVLKYARHNDAHIQRYAETTRALLRYAPPPRMVLDLGGFADDISTYRPIAQTLAEFRYDVRSYDEDLREILRVESGSQGCVLCTEVLEHIKDTDDDRRDAFVGRCRQQFLCEMARVLAPGGRLLLSTPNACALSNAHRLACGQTPVMYTRHIQEISVSHLRQLFSGTGLREVALWTSDVWDMFFMTTERAEMWLAFYRTAGYDMRDRGDCTFVVMEKSL